MAFDPGDHARMTYLISREKEAQKQLEEAREAVLQWVKRGKLAIEADLPELVPEAKARAIEAKQKFDAVQAELDRLALEKAAMVHRRPGPDHEATIRAETLVEQFRMQGFSPEEQEANDVASRMEAELRLQAIKAGRQGPPPPAATIAPADLATEVGATQAMEPGEAAEMGPMEAVESPEPTGLETSELAEAPVTSEIEPGDLSPDGVSEAEGRAEKPDGDATPG
ncbi:MAG: hypothetical protein JW797_11975 [Bradymonadales bacterium]|nr:hypothetical protein [Bradymonadales bacterium]